VRLLVLCAAWLPAAGAARAGGDPAPYPPDEEALQHAILSQELAQRGAIAARAAEAFRREALVLEGDRDPLDIVLRRTAALLSDLRSRSDAPALAVADRELHGLRTEAERVAVENAAARRALLGRALGLRRRVAFANPLLDFDRILFVKRHRSIYNHMCDQYYGMTANPGGGLYVLEHPWGAQPSARDLLADAPVASGRLKGQRLSGGPGNFDGLAFNGMGGLGGPETEGGSFLSPDLSYDGRTILFAYVECRGERAQRFHLEHARGHWDEGRCYHVFKVGADGSGLEQLTDGTFNDFDPCWLPNGRIAFISERRGGYLRCGRACPTFTLFDMAADGSDIRCLSFHETNEWHPSVGHDGMILFTRWDYVDRHGCTAHQPWTITPDGRDPRAVHGNYALRYRRPDMELDVRAIPGSPRLVATAAPHHGQAYGSLVLVDPRVQDDDGMGPLRRLTPDVGFPETQGGTESYGEAWPLDEDYYLCAYDPMANRRGRGDYGLFLVDSFGNRERIYHDPDIGSHNPIPLRARPAPPIVPDASVRAPPGDPAEATVGVANVYRTRSPWPEGTRIRALRVYQALPLAMPTAHIPHHTGLQCPQGLESINIARAVLGTVPVEADGSAHFVVPARRELFFQALDEQGLAVTSMRSVTQFQPGEKATCVGCHEPRHGSPPPPPAAPLAFRRQPSRIEPDVDGTNPFSYPRLVQPVLDRHCVKCHAESAGKAPPLDAAPVQHGCSTYTASYMSLAPKFGFYDYGGRDFNDPRWYRTTPGEFGAHGSGLFKLLRKGHHDVTLPPEDLHRLAVWLDACSLFYGVYEREGGLAQLRGELARPTLE
jgi:hypothetical protein